MGRPSVNVYYVDLKEIGFNDSCVNEVFGVASLLGFGCQGKGTWWELQAPWP